MTTFLVLSYFMVAALVFVRTIRTAPSTSRYATLTSTPFGALALQLTLAWVALWWPALVLPLVLNEYVSYTNGEAL